jgi:FMN phosphatase YigB (HAD superfamily)
VADSDGRSLETYLESTAAVSLDLFGTLVTVDRPDNTAAAIAEELERRGVTVPEDWETAFREPHLDVKEGAELALGDHVAAALASRTDANPENSRETVDSAVRAAFTIDAEVRPGAEALVERCRARRPVGVLSNCSVPGLGEHALDNAGLDTSPVVTSVDCGWRKPDPRAFAAIADELGVDPAELLHIGDDPATDGGVTDVGGTSLIVGDGELAAWRDQWD